MTPEELLRAIFSNDHESGDACPECDGFIVADALDDQIVCTNCGWRG